MLAAAGTCASFAPRLPALAAVLRSINTSTTAATALERCALQKHAVLLTRRSPLPPAALHGSAAAQTPQGVAVKPTNWAPEACAACSLPDSRPSAAAPLQHGARRRRRAQQSADDGPVPEEERCRPARAAQRAAQALPGDRRAGGCCGAALACREEAGSSTGQASGLCSFCWVSRHAAPLDSCSSNLPLAHCCRPARHKSGTAPGLSRCAGRAVSQ